MATGGRKNGLKVVQSLSCVKQAGLFWAMLGPLEVVVVVAHGGGGVGGSTWWWWQEMVGKSLEKPLEKRAQ